MIRRKIATACVYGVVRKIDRTKPRQYMQLTSGGRTGGGSDWRDIFDDCWLTEQHGFTSGVPLGARGLVVKPGGTEEYTACIGPQLSMQRPTWLESGEVCVWTSFSSRMVLEADGQVRIESDLADYKDSREDLDEGAKLRLKAGGVKGHLEAYGEEQVLVRSQPAGGTGAQAIVRVSKTGEIFIEADDGNGKTTTVTVNPDSVQVVSDGHVDIESMGNITLKPTGGGEVRLGDSGGLQYLVLEAKLQTQIDAIIASIQGHSHANHGLTPTPAPLVIPVPTNSFAAANAKAKA